LYYGQKYTQRKINIEFSFYEISETQLQHITKLFNDSGIGELIFDEAPHKVYSAKVNGKVTLKHLCFEKANGERIYNGEGSVDFICYFPFARSRFPYLEDYTVSTIPEWTPDYIKKDYVSLTEYTTVEQH
jgi:phage-related protein